MTTLPTFADFLKLLDRDPFARAAWFANIRAGASTEQALIGVAVTLVGAREELATQVVRRMAERPSLIDNVRASLDDELVDGPTVDNGTVVRAEFSVPIAADFTPSQAVRLS